MKVMKVMKVIQAWPPLFELLFQDQNLYSLPLNDGIPNVKKDDTGLENGIK